MDYIYGELNERVEQAEYTGVTSSTAQVVVDNSANTICVNVLTTGEPFVSVINSTINRLDRVDEEQAHYVVTSVSQTDGQVSATKKKLEITDVTNLQTTLNNKQAQLSFEGTYSAKSNRVVTREYMEDAIAELSRAMFFVGISSTSPKTGVVTVDNEVIVPANGFVTVYNKSEWIYYNSGWYELGDESKYIIKNSQAITDSDVADETISVVKIKGLTNLLSTLQNDVKALKAGGSTVINKEEHSLDLLSYV